MSQHHTKKTSQSQLFSGIYPIGKHRGETLAVLLERFRDIHGIDDSTKLTYAGRLDPMAEGVVLVLAGESRFQKDALLRLPKVYEVDVLLGIATDTHDALGMITSVSLGDIRNNEIEKAIVDMQAITTLPYPMYSSVSVQGKPLFLHARAGTSVEIPNKKVTIYEATLISIQEESLREVAMRACSDIQKVLGDFRQEAVIAKWQNLSSEGTVTMIRIVVHASSGTYMRSLAVWIGERLGVPALAYRIKRTSVGEYVL